jgi:uncharacterized RDD family membrane protein YckC
MTNPPPVFLLRRLAAGAYDTLLCTALVFGVAMLFTLITGSGGEKLQTPGPLEEALLQLTLLAVVAAYFLFSWIRSGQTVGMRAWRIRLVAAEGGYLPWDRAGLRLVVALAGLLAAGAGLWWAYLDPHRRTWADRAANSRVERQPSPAQ